MNVRKISILLILSVLMMQSCDSNSLKRAMAKYYFSDFDLEAVGGNVSTMNVIDSAETIIIPEIVSDVVSVNYKEICDTVFIVRLETAKNCLLGRILKFSLLNDTIYVKDKYQSLMMFAPDGKFVRKISNIGQGPGEYSELTDFFVDDKIYILDNMRSKLSVFSKTGEFLYDSKLPFLSLQIGKLNPETFVFRAFNNYNLHINALDNYCIWTTDTCFNVQKRGMYCDLELNKFFSNPNGMCFADGLASLYEMETDSLFVITENFDLRCRYVLKFNDYHTFDIFKNMTSMEYKKFFNTNEDYIWVLGCRFNNSFVVVNFMQRGKGTNWLLYNSNSKKTCLINEISFNGVAVISLDELFDEFVFYKDYFVVSKDHLEMPRKGEITKYVGGYFGEIKDDDNPVLVFFKMKPVSNIF